MVNDDFDNKPVLSVFGMGYVGIVSSVSFANLGYKVIGVDVNEEKLKQLTNGKPPLYEPGLVKRLNSAIKNEKIHFNSDGHKAVLQSTISIIAVGTPSDANGGLNLDYVISVASEIGSYLMDINRYHLIVLRSTVLPGSCKERIIPVIEKASGKKYGKDFGFIFNPEFLREGSAFEDFENSPLTVAGGEFDRDISIIRNLYEFCINDDNQFFAEHFEFAELLKYVNNTFHALKISFANEIGVLAKSANVDGHRLMNAFCADTKLNISSAYLRPGFAFGGSCLPKDTSALISYSKSKKIDTKLISSILESNDAHIKRIEKIIAEKRANCIGFLGISFKPGTDDVRESASLKLLGNLLSHGHALKYYDTYVNENAVKSFLNQSYGYIDKIEEICSPSVKELVSLSDVIVVTDPNLVKELSLSMFADKIVIDLVRCLEDKIRPSHYYGIAW